VRVGVLLINLGTPDSSSPKDVFRYLNEFLTDKRVMDLPWVLRQLLVRCVIVPFRYKKSAESYKKIWTDEGSPLKVHGINLVKEVQKLLGERFHVVLAMRYQNPSIEKALSKLQKCHHLVVLPLFPQYASATTGSVLEEVLQKISTWQVIPSLTIINQFFSYEPLIRLFAENARKWEVEDYDHILFSFHGLPERQIRKADKEGVCLSTGCCDTLCSKNFHCYKAQCSSMARKIADQLGLLPSRFTVCYQSRLGSDPWLQPYTSDVITSLAKKGAKKLLVLCPAFVADCLETIEEIQQEYAHLFKEQGGDVLDLVPSLNSDFEWAEAVAALIRKSIPQKIEREQLKIGTYERFE
jgi:ferrochelatase